MKPVPRHAIIDHVTYEESVRPALRQRVLAAKAPRRVHVGEHFTFLFENTLTMQYQIQEMVRVERLVREADILHEVETYNDLLGGDGELAATLMIEIDDPSVRAVKLSEWLHLPEHIYVVLDDGSRVRPTFDPAQVGADRVSSVQYLKFLVGGRVPTAVGVDLPGAEAETRLTAEQRAALAEDLAS
jgi:uncharacterized protein DUF3501